MDKSKQPDPVPEAAKEGDRADKAGSAKRVKNNVRKMRTDKMMSKAELARRSGMSTLTIDRVERGLPCRMDTKRKILEALGLQPSDRVAVFGDDEED
jgi:DNA-binding Xre family transcriptional regulator